MDKKVMGRMVRMLARRMLAGDSGYVYDPEHRNRPHGGGVWHKTEKGWSTYEGAAPKGEPGKAPAIPGMKGNSVFRGTGHVEFHDGIKAAWESNPPDVRWRVDVHDADDYRDCKTFVTDSGSTVAIRPDGDIISVCKKAGSRDYGSDLLKFAVANGGRKLDAFENLYEFYTKNGFRPVSCTDFDEDYAPEGWTKGRDDKEAIIFYAYQGKPYTEKTMKEFLDSVPHYDYDEAGKIRDKELEK